VLNFFPLLKSFGVTTSPVESRLAVVIGVEDLVMDDSFVLAHADFLGGSTCWTIRCAPTWARR
jgi:hypothetical protein